MKKIIAPFVFFLAVSLQALAQTPALKIDSLISAHAKDARFNGVVLVAEKGKIILEKGYGFKNAEQKKSNDANTVFQVGSVTKQFTAAIVSQLQQEKKLSVKDKLSKYFPGFPNGDKITIEHLLTHTSGIYNYTNDTVLMRGDVTRPRTESEMIAFFKNRPLSFEPGTKFEYSNSGYSLLGYIIEKVTKKPYEKVMRERILQPLQMTRSGFDFTHLASPDKAKGYFALGGAAASPAPVVDSTIAYAAGALYATAGDLYKWERSIYTDKILTPESWKTTFTPFRRKYGYGWSIDTLFNKTLHAHSGGIHGFSSFLVRFPKEEVVIIMLSNASSPGLDNLSKSIAAVVFNQPYELPLSNTEIKVDTAILKQYTGEYELAPSFTITVTLKDGHLFGQGTGQPQFELFPKSETRFFLKAVVAEVAFLKGTDGTFSEMMLYQGGREVKGVKIK
jgi:CubicO group peptidase (beta-lactamase class C family)